MNSSEPPPSPDEPQEHEPGPLGAQIDFTSPDSPLGRYLLSTSEVAAVLLLAVVFLFYAWAPSLWHTDIWGHLCFGRWMVEHGAFPEHEPFSFFSDHESRYIPFGWATQVGAYLLFHAGERLAGGDWRQQLAGGAEMLRTTHALLTLARLAFLLFAFRRLTGSMPLACAGVGIVLFFSLAPAATQRPQVVGECLFAALLLFLSRPQLSRFAFLGIPLLFVVWANAHGSFIVGLVLLGAVFTGKVIEVCRDRGSWNPLSVLADVQGRRLLLVVLLAAAAVMVNPLGPWLYGETFRFSANPNLKTLEEWGPLQFSFEAGGHWGYLGTLLLLLVSQLFSPRAMTPSQIIVLLVFATLPCLQERMMVWWVMLVPWLALPLWAAITERLRGGREKASRAASLHKTLLAAVIVALTVLLSPPVQWLLARHPRQSLARILSPTTPWQLAAVLTDKPGAAEAIPALSLELKRGYPGGRFTGRIFASETLGDYLVWALPPDMPVLVYTHAHLFPPDHWRDSLEAQAGEPTWRETLALRRVNLVVIESVIHSKLADALRKDPDWLVVLDEAENSRKPNPGAWLLVALRKKPR